MSYRKCKAGKGKGAGNYLRYKDIDEKRKALEKLAKRLIEYVEKHENIYDWSQIHGNWSFSYGKISALSRSWACIKEAKEYCNKIFEGRLVNLGMERSKLSDSFVKFLLERRHGWREKQEVEMKVEGSLSFRDLVSGDNNEEKGGDDEEIDNDEEIE